MPGGEGRAPPSPPYQFPYCHTFVLILSLSQLPQLLETLDASTAKTQEHIPHRLFAQDLSLPPKKTQPTFSCVSQLGFSYSVSTGMRGSHNPGTTISLQAFPTHFYHTQGTLPLPSSRVFWSPRNASIKGRAREA